MMRNWLKTFFHVFLEALPLFGLIFVINPILIALSTREPFEYKLSFVLLGIVCLCVCALIAFPVSFFSDKYRTTIIAFLRSLFLVFFIVSIFYPESVGQVDGGVARNFPLLYYCVFYFIVFLSVVFLMIFFIKSKIFLRNIYVVFAIFGAVAVLYFPLQQRLFSEAQSHYSDKTDLTFASERNIIFIFADMLQGSAVEQYLTMNPKEKINFQGVTLFSRATSPFPFTSYAAPAILSGNIYSNSENKSSFQTLKDARSSSLITDAVDSDFDSTVIGLEDVKLHTDQICYQSSNLIQTARIFLDLSIQRIAKISVGQSEMWLLGYKEKCSKIMEHLTNAPVGKSKNKILFFHSLIPHAPIVFKRQHLERMPHFLRPLQETTAGYFDEMGFFLGQLDRLFQHMKRIGVYDKSLIVITGDHGHFIGRHGSLYHYPGAEDFEGFKKGEWARPFSMYNAAILIKPPFKTGELQISRVASSTLGLRPLVQQYLANETADLLKGFEILGKNKVVVFKDGIKSSPYESADDHVILEFTGNVSALAQQLEEEE